MQSNYDDKLNQVEKAHGPPSLLTRARWKMMRGETLYVGTGAAFGVGLAAVLFWVVSREIAITICACFIVVQVCEIAYVQWKLRQSRIDFGEMLGSEPFRECPVDKGFLCIRCRKFQRFAMPEERGGITAGEAWDIGWTCEDSQWTCPFCNGNESYQND